MSVVKFTINGTLHTVTNADPDTSLNTYLRKNLQLRGSKAMCHEGGCGACVVSASIVHPVTKEKEIKAVNSCLVSVFSCHGWEITTIEGIGDRKKGYHPIQKRLASFNGTQCGFCSPGFVMNMYSFNENKNGNISMLEVENSFGSNICRCTGYRPICDAFKSFAKDATIELLRKVQDIEDISSLTHCQKTGEICTKSCEDYSLENDFCIINADIHLDEQCLELTLPNQKWIKVSTLDDIFKIFKNEGLDSYMLVAGNTGQGIVDFEERTKNTKRIMIDITNVAELRQHSVEANLVVGANMTLTELIELFQNISEQNEYYYYTKQMVEHLDKVAHIPVRNIGTIAGNLMLKHKYREFPSDVFLLFETVGATVKIVDASKKPIFVTLQDFLKINMKGKVLHSIHMPPLSSDYIFQSYKIMRRAQNDHAVVNAGFLFKINSENKTIKRASIVYGGISDQFIHATATEKRLIGKDIFNEETLKMALVSLNGEINPTDNPPEPSAAYKKKLALSLFYKCILQISPPNSVNPLFISGGEEFVRPVSHGKQEFSTQKNEWPLTKPMPKMDGQVQCSGETEYTLDVPNLPNEVYAAFVLSNVYDGEIDKIDAQDALNMKGVIALLTVKDIPGTNTFTPIYIPFSNVDEKILSDGPIEYNGQPVAIIVAENERLANMAALKVKVTYKNSGKRPPYINIKDVLKDPAAKQRIQAGPAVPAKSKGNDIVKVIKGSFEFKGQFHFTMETQTCVCVPIEDGMDVYSSTQWLDYTQMAISRALNIKENSINMNLRRIGGGYGSKLTRCHHVATACALTAYKLNRPVRFVEPLETNMAKNGKRLPCYSEYELGVDKNGKIQYMNHTFYEDKGYSPNENVILYLAVEGFQNCYDSKNWNITSNLVLTNTACNTWFRAPGTNEGIAMIENIMDNIAVEIGKSPIDVRIANMVEVDNPLPDLIKTFKEDSNYEERYTNVIDFNSKNRWRKKGINLSMMKFNMPYYGHMGAYVAIYHDDGTVAVSHGGIEMGQGINTKVAQVCAYTLGIPLDMVSIKPTDVLITPNSTLSGGSVTSEQCCYATKKACEIILERLKPIKDANPSVTWKELISSAFTAGVNLSANYYAKQSEISPYSTYGLGVIEVEVDILTGRYYIMRVDILVDTGESLSPEIDVGQAEGAFIMGLGNWTTENLIYNQASGKLLTNRTWNYKPYGMKDIPVDFRVQFRRNAPNPLGVLRSKTCAEPPLTLAYGIVPAIRQAITSARQDNGLPVDTWWNMDMPLTAENILTATNIDFNKFKLK